MRNYAFCRCLIKKKNDRSFVRGVHEDETDRSLITLIMGPGRKLGCAIVAEGIEHRSQLEFFVSEGCGLFQGCLFNASMPVKASEEVLVMGKDVPPSWLGRLTLPAADFRSGLRGNELDEAQYPEGRSDIHEYGGNPSEDDFNVP